ncbi:SidA/IucD/PvdA family monooxygenase [Amycolatopsis pithecellobii]|uniref:L-lysine N6-monooxygenase MbtG n=1 Tax=Amycolatopsis pithecellobii TaxID=664692 RepID=A0A6N7YVP2_9PSEU|nr:SidA/IucD/PvdA family monooxygenase [Amycolatopsis pithecellobii]MTD52389.1 SidA/IucD/PvdA family monooxygenase [Amycolatopsis pithecellobii]
MADYDADVIGIGFGPSNIALAIALEELYPDTKALFLEIRGNPGWQAGMLLSGSDIQHNPIRDLVTLRNPRSRFSFINYLHEENRLVPFLNLGLPFPLRKDYARYVSWAAAQFPDRVQYGATVTAVRVIGDLAEVELASGQRLRARSVVVAPGRPPNIPAPFRGTADPRIFHYTRFLDYLTEFEGNPAPRIAVVGGSQAAAELVLDISARFPEGHVHNVVRGFGYRQKDLSPFHGEVYFPEFVDYYYSSSDETKHDLDRQLRYTNYSAADLDVLDALNARLYEQGLDGHDQIELHRNTEVARVRPGPAGVTLALTQRHRGTTTEITVDAVALATGFTDLTDEHGSHFLPQMLEPIRPRVDRTPSGRASIGRDYRVLAAPADSLPPIHLNGVCETTHGLGDAGSFSLVSLRAAAIADSLSKSLAA